MKVNKIILSLVALISAGSALANTSGTIQFSGKVVAGTCSIVAGDVTKSVLLPGVPNSALSSSGDEAGAVPFALTFENCAVGDVAYAHFSPVTNLANIDGSHIKNTGTATNVALALYEQDGATAIDLSQALAGESVSGSAAAPGNDVSLNYVVKYHATGAAGAGSVQGQLMYDIVYK